MSGRKAGQNLLLRFWFWPKKWLAKSQKLFCFLFSPLIRHFCADYLLFSTPSAVFWTSFLSLFLISLLFFWVFFLMVRMRRKIGDQKSYKMIIDNIYLLSLVHQYPKQNSKKQNACSLAARTTQASTKNSIFPSSNTSSMYSSSLNICKYCPAISVKLIHK